MPSWVHYYTVYWLSLHALAPAPWLWLQLNPEKEYKHAYSGNQTVIFIPDKIKALDNTGFILNVSFLSEIQLKIGENVLLSFVNMHVFDGRIGFITP